VVLRTSVSTSGIIPIRKKVSNAIFSSMRMSTSRDPFISSVARLEQESYEESEKRGYKDIPAISTSPRH